GLRARKAGQALPPLLGDDRRDRQLELERDAQRTPPLPAQPADLPPLDARQALRHPPRPTRSISQRPIARLPAPYPLPEPTPAHPHPPGDDPEGLPADYPSNRQDSP